jgi:flavin-dependent dehydrogenase
MPNRPQYDVAIVGASIAGCTAAILFARNGARVALIERDPDPAAYKKSARISFHPDYQAAWFRGCNRSGSGIGNDVEVFTRWGWIVPPPRRNTTRPAYGYNIRRETLDPMIRKRAIATPGVNFMPGFTARELLVSKSRSCNRASNDLVIVRIADETRNRERCCARSPARHR